MVNPGLPDRPDPPGPDPEPEPSVEEELPASDKDARDGTTITSRIRATFRRRRGWVVLIAAVVALLVFRLLAPDSVDVEVGSVRLGRLEVSVDAEGTTRTVDRFVVTAPVAGRLQRIGLREGDFVDAGEVISTITAAPLDARAASESLARIGEAEARREEAAALLDETTAALSQAERTAARIAVLQQAGAESRETRELAELERIKAQRESSAARSRLIAAEAELAAAQRAATLSDSSAPIGITRVRAPVSGRVLRVEDPSERVVTPGASLLEIAQPNRLEIVAEVLTSDAVLIRPGAAMYITGWGGDPLEGRVRLVEPSAFTKQSALGVEEQRVRVVGDFLNQPSGLGDGYGIDAAIVTWAATGVTKVPTAALFRIGESWGTFRVEEGRARLRRIEVGHRGNEEAEVLAGLEDGDVVVLYPPDRLADGTQVNVP